jgi:voltage-gated potassium channel
MRTLGILPQNKHERQLWRTTRKIAGMLAALLAVQIVGAYVYASIEGISFLDGLYSVVMLMTAIGSSRDPATLTGKWFNIGLALFSVVMLIGVMSQIGQLVLRREFLKMMYDWSHKRMKDHTILCGLSNTAIELLNRLPHDQVVAVVRTHDDAHKVKHERDDVVVHIADYTSSKALRNAGVEHAALVIACSDSDADNAFTCLTAKKIRATVPVITRMSRSDNREKMQECGSDAIISPAELAADAIMASRGKLVKG